jgi:hypothetical protein
MRASRPRAVSTARSRSYVKQKSKPPGHVLVVTGVEVAGDEGGGEMGGDDDDVQFESDG